MSSDASPTVLIVDDDPAVAVTFSRMLRLAGFAVATAFDAEAGLRQVSADHPDAVLVDLSMPLMDGVAFVRELRAREDCQHTPVAIVTGDYGAAESVSGELRDLDAAVYFKPLWLADLVHIARRLISQGTPLS